MANNKPWEYDDFNYNDFTYKDYTESEAVKALGTKKTSAENAYNSYGDFAWSDQDKYNNLIKGYENRDKFSYDFNADALYQQYKDKYIQQGKMAMADTIGQASAMTGGYGNSYAASVGNQAYQASLQNLNDVIPQLYQLALDKYNMEGQEMLNMIGLMGDERNFAYGTWSDKYNRLASDRDYYGTQYNNERTWDYGLYSDDRTFDYSKYSADRSLAYDKYSTDKNLSYSQYRDAIADDQWAQQMALTQEQWEWEKAQAEKAASNSGGGGGGGNDNGTTTNSLWYDTGTYDDNGNKVFRNSENKTMSFAEGVNPYTGTKHKDAKHGTFSNGYQPNNINGTKLKNSGMSTNVTGKNQTIWEANGKYYLWRGDENRYVEVDVSDLD